MTAHLYPLGTDISIKTGRGWANVIGISFKTFNLYIKSWMSIIPNINRTVTRYLGTDVTN